MGEFSTVSIEVGQDLVPMVALTDSGDHALFESDDDLWSGKSGYAAKVRPDGLTSGGKITPATGSDAVAIAKVVVRQAGEDVEIAATASQAVTRPSTGTHKIDAITITDAQAIAVIQGDESTAFSNTPGAAGGPPFIPVGSVLVGLVRMASQTSAPITDDEIRQVPGDSMEMTTYPKWDDRPLRSENGALISAGVEFKSPLPLIHTGGLPKAVYAEYYTPVFAVEDETKDFVPPETSHSTSSEAIYGGTRESKTTSKSQGTFTAYLDTGISETLIDIKDQTLFFKFIEDRMRPDVYIICQGTLGIARTFSPTDRGSTVACTITPRSGTDTVNIYA